MSWGMRSRNEHRDSGVQELAVVTGVPLGP